MKRTGFTLIELCIVIFILAALAAVLAPLMIQGIDSWLTIRDQDIILSRARLAMNRIIEELRFDCVALNSTSDNTIRFTNSPASGGDIITFFVTTDPDGITRHLSRLNQALGTARILARNLADDFPQDGLQVSYFVFDPVSTPPLRAYNPGPDDIADISFIRFRILFDSDSFPGNEYVFESGVSPRFLP